RIHKPRSLTHLAIATYTTSAPLPPRRARTRSVSRSTSQNPIRCVAGGIAPPRSRRTRRDTLASYGSHCSAAYGLARSTGFLPSLVDPGFGLNNAVPSVQLHYRAFIPTTDRPAPVPRIGTLILAGAACLDFSL